MTLIGLTLRVKLLRVLPIRFKVTIEIYPGSHQSEVAVNKQLNDKERVAAALENKHLLDVVNKCISGVDAEQNVEQNLVSEEVVWMKGREGKMSMSMSMSIAAIDIDIQYCLFGIECK